MKKLLMSIMTIGIAAAMLGAGTFSYFSDTETSKGNTFTAGTVDISVDDENPWEKSYTVENIEPCYTGWITFIVKNVGTSPMVVWKMLSDIVCEGGDHPESEEEEDPNDTINNIASWIFYDLIVKGETIIDDDQEIRVDNVNNCWIKLGTLGAEESMVVEQSYHLRPETTNWAQGDKMTFIINLLAVQTNAPGPVPTSGTMTLENKDAYWEPITGDGISGTVNYDYDDNADILSGTFTATGLTPDATYDLIYYSDPWPGTGGLVLGTGTADGTGNILSTIFTGTPVPDPNDMNLPVGVKVWLVPNGEFVPDTPATWPNGWNPDDYLFEMNLINLPQ